MPIRRLVGACQGGHLEVAQLLLPYFATNQQTQTEADAYDKAFLKACKGGHLPVATLLLASAPDKQHIMIAKDNCIAFQEACLWNQWAIVKLLLKKSANQQDMIKANSFKAFRNAAAKGHYVITQLLLEDISPDKKQAMIAENNYEAFCNASKGRHLQSGTITIKTCSSPNKTYYD